MQRAAPPATHCPRRAAALLTQVSHHDNSLSAPHPTHMGIALSTTLVGPHQHSPGWLQRPSTHRNLGGSLEGGGTG